MFNDTYNCEPKGIPLVSFYKQIKNAPYASIFTSMHYHSDFEVLYITEGSAKMNVAGNTFYPCKGSLVLINPYEIHYGELVSSELSYYCIDFNPGMLQPYGETRTSYREMKYINHIAEFDCESIICNIHRAYENEESGWKLKATGFLMVLFSKLAGTLIDASASKETEFAKAVISYVSNNYDRTVTSKDAADALSYNQSYFCRMFKNHFGISFGKYLGIVRLKIAKELLEKETVSSAAMKCGFSNISFFSTEFKKLYDMSPMQYKKLIAKTSIQNN